MILLTSLNNGGLKVTSEKGELFAKDRRVSRRFLIEGKKQCVRTKKIKLEGSRWGVTG